MDDWVSRWVRQASEIIRLRNELTLACKERDLYAGLLQREEERNALLWNDLKAEGRAHNQALRRYADNVSKQANLPQHFVKDSAAAPPPVPEAVDEAQEAQIKWQAEIQMQADIDRGIKPEALEWYIDIIRQDPKRYIIG